jgi:hypothetical protein
MRQARGTAARTQRVCFVVSFCSVFGGFLSLFGFELGLTRRWLKGRVNLHTSKTDRAEYLRLLNRTCALQMSTLRRSIRACSKTHHKFFSSRSLRVSISPASNSNVHSTSTKNIVYKPRLTKLIQELPANHEEHKNIQSQ